MNFDLRLPLGIIFGVYGLVLAAYGCFTNQDAALYQQSLGINMNLYWGLVMLAFGGIMLLFALRGKKNQ